MRYGPITFAKKYWNFCRATGAYNPAETPVFLCKSYGSVLVFDGSGPKFFCSANVRSRVQQPDVTGPSHASYWPRGQGYKFQAAYAGSLNEINNMFRRIFNEFELSNRLSYISSYRESVKKKNSCDIHFKRPNCDSIAVLIVKAPLGEGGI